MALKTKWLLSKAKSYSCTMTGVWRAVAYCNGCVVIFHSPPGCLHVASSMDLGNHYRLMADGTHREEEPIPLISSNLREKDSIFGGIDRLHACIEYTVSTYHPECILIASSCTAGVIGDDVEEEAKSAELTYGIPVLALPYSGFLGGEYADGYYPTVTKIVDRFFKQNEHKEGSVLLLGDQMGPHGQYAREVKRLLALLGLHADYQFPGYVPFREWKNITSASWSLILGTGTRLQPMEELASRLENDFCVKFIGNVYPVGFDNTCRWIRRVSSVIGKEELGNQIIMKETEELERKISSYRKVTENKKVCLCIGRGIRWYHPKETIESVHRLGMDLSAVILFPNLTEEDKKEIEKEKESLSEAPLCDSQEGEKFLHEADIILTTNEIPDINKKQLFIPMVALSGIDGERAFLRSIYRLVCRRGRSGGISYVKA